MTIFISLHGIKYEMKLRTSDLPGFYMYRLIPIVLGYDPAIIYISLNRDEYWMNGKPNEVGKKIENSEIFYFHKR
jgi:hypothetical protein